MTITLAELSAQHGVTVLEHLEADAEVPVLEGLQAQGDLLVIPVTETPHDPGRLRFTQIPEEGVPVIPAASDAAHEHRLFASVPGTAWWASLHDGTEIGVVRCTQPVYILHAEHGALGVAPGSYLLRRQREQADQERLVAD